MDPREFRYQMLRFFFEAAAALPAGYLLGHAWRELLDLRDVWSPAWHIGAEVVLAGLSIWLLTLGGWHVRKVAKALALRAVGAGGDEG